MFSGIIEAFGTIKKIKRGQESSVLTIESPLAKELKKGNSIAVNGVCLTVTAKKNKSFTLDIMPETIFRTDLFNLRVEDKVNLERPLAANGRFEGHIVQGHVDATGIIIEKKEVENAHELFIKTEKKILDFCIEKGSIAVDGISLTIVEIKRNTFSVSIIPYTSQNTTLGIKNKGDSVNLEVDIIGKYIAKFIS